MADIVLTFTTGARAGAGACAGGFPPTAAPAAAAVLVRVDLVLEIAMVDFCCSPIDSADFSNGFTCRRNALLMYARIKLLDNTLMFS